MKNNILGGLVIFFVVVCCLLMIDDISNVKEDQTTYEATEVEDAEKSTDLAVMEPEE